MFNDFLDRWGGAFRDFDGAADPAAEGAMIDDLQARFRGLTEAPKAAPRGSMGKAIVLVGLLAGGLVAWIAWGIVEDRRVAGIEAAAADAVAADERLAGYPMTVAFDHEAETLRIAGLVPDAVARSGLRQRLQSALPSVALDFGVSPIPDTSGGSGGAD